MTRQLASRVLMIRPSNFGFDPETAASNRFQRAPTLGAAELADEARREFDAFAAALSDAGVAVDATEDTTGLPDAVFPNNWLSFSPDRPAVLWPMATPLRRRERRPELAGDDVLDLSAWEAEGLACEGTGSLVFDHARRLAFAALSPRTHRVAAERACALLGYEPVLFESASVPYHTNVVLAMGDGWAAAVVDEVPSPVRDRLPSAILELSTAQGDNFAANLLQLTTPRGPVIALSDRARCCLSASQLAFLEARGRLVCPDLRVIEEVGGGSARCMLCERF
jgi:hypothetical protein